MQNYMILILVILSTGTAILSMKIYLQIPSKWLCEYDESPSEIHSREFRTDNKFKTAVILLVGALFYFAVLYIKLLKLYGSEEIRSYFLITMEYLKITLVFITVFVCAMSDMRYMIIPDQLCILLIVIAVFGVLTSGDDLTGGFLGIGKGLFTSGGLMFLSAVIIWVIYGADSMGAGDIKLIAACGAVVGGGAAGVLYIVTILLNAVYIAAGLLSRKFTSNSVQPLAHCIGAATLICIAFS